MEKSSQLIEAVWLGKKEKPCRSCHLFFIFFLDKRMRFMRLQHMCVVLFYEYLGMKNRCVRQIGLEVRFDVDSSGKTLCFRRTNNLIR